MVSFLLYWALEHFIDLAGYLHKTEDVNKYTAAARQVKSVSERVLWDGEWYARGITKSGRKIGVKEDPEGKIFIESNTWAVLSGAAEQEHGLKAMDAVDRWLYTPYGLVLCAPPYTKPDDEIGFITRVYPGLKENGAVFSHSNPWAWAAEAGLAGAEEQ